MIICLGDELLNYVPLTVSLLLKDYKVRLKAVECVSNIVANIISVFTLGSRHTRVYTFNKPTDNKIQGTDSSSIREDIHACVYKHYCLSQFAI